MLNTELAITDQDCQEDNQLEAYADQVANEVFKPLYETDNFLLSRLQSNQCAYAAFARELVARWTVPDEEQQQVEADIQLYVPVKRRRKR
jgi:hypothetical protein